MVEKTLILKQISGMLCLLNSYSKFTRPKPDSSLSHTKIYVIIGAEEKQATPEEAFVFPAPISERIPAKQETSVFRKSSGRISCVIKLMLRPLFQRGRVFF